MGNMTTFSLFSLLLVCSSSLVTASASTCNSRDRTALLDLYAGFGSPPSLSSWITPGVACCDWVGVKCFDSHRVQSLQLFSLDLSGTISPAIGDLSELQELWVTGNPRLSGTIPPSITKLKKLGLIELSNNSLSGPIPDYVSELTSLQYLRISYNKFSGPIPSWLPTSLRSATLLLDNNQLSGPIPDFSNFGDGNIFFHNNKLSGPIPRSLGGRGIAVINLSHNRLTGDASFLFGTSNQTTEIELDHNRLSFDLSNVIFPPNLMALDLSHNYIYGSIPDSINYANLGFNLDYFDVSYNLLCGEIPPGPVTGKFGPKKYAHNKCLYGEPLPPCK